MLGYVVFSAVSHHRCALVASAGDVATHFVAMLACDQRAHLRIRVGAVADFDLLQPCADGIHQAVAHIAHSHHCRHRHAAFPRRAVSRAHRCVRSRGHIGIGQHDHVVLSPSQSLGALAVAGGRLIHMAGDGGGADEAYRGHIGMLQQPLH